MASNLDPSQKAKMAVLFVVVGLAFYFNFKSKEELFFSKDYLYERMLRTQKLAHGKSKKDISSYQEHYSKLIDDFHLLIPVLKERIAKEGLSFEGENQDVLDLVIVPFEDWSIDLFSNFRKNWVGKEFSQGHYRKFSIKNFIEFRSEGDLFVHFTEMLNNRGRSFFKMRSFERGKGPVIYGETSDRTENLFWISIGYPISRDKILWFTNLRQIDEKHRAYQLVVETVKGRRLEIDGFKFSTAITDPRKIVQLDQIAGEFQAQENN